MKRFEHTVALILAGVCYELLQVRRESLNSGPSSTPFISQNLSLAKSCSQVVVRSIVSVLSMLAYTPHRVHAFLRIYQVLYANDITGANEIISMIKFRPRATKLILDHNTLGDEGCEALFCFLSSERKCITDIKMVRNNIGNRGLLAIARYLSNNQCLSELHLQGVSTSSFIFSYFCSDKYPCIQNLFENTSSVITAFTEALNTSHLEKLKLTSNFQLSDPFITTFLPLLTSPHLRELCLGLVGLTPLSVPYLTAYISSTRCQLYELSLSGNFLGVDGVNKIVGAMEDNFSLESVQLYSNLRSGETNPTINNTHLHKLKTRNQYRRQMTQKEALEVLVASRTLLLSPKSKERETTQASTIQALPTEIKLHILSLLSSFLSSSQLLRIFAFASTLDTLPPLLPRLSSTKVCQPDSSRIRPGFSLRQAWLKEMGCYLFEQERG